MREKIKDTILKIAKREGIKIDKIILFGSRARGEASEDSDWDILILIDDQITQRKEKKIFSLILSRLAEKRIDCDLIIKSKKQMSEKKNLFLKEIYYKGYRVYG